MVVELWKKRGGPRRGAPPLALGWREVGGGRPFPASRGSARRPGASFRPPFWSSRRTRPGGRNTPTHPAHLSARVRGRLCTLSLWSVHCGQRARAWAGGGVVLPKTLLFRERERAAVGDSRPWSQRRRLRTQEVSPLRLVEVSLCPLAGSPVLPGTTGSPSWPVVCEEKTGFECQAPRL